MTTSSTGQEIVVYEKPLELLDEEVHLSNADLVREINKLRQEINRLKSK